MAIEADPKLGRGYLGFGFLEAIEGRVAESERWYRYALDLMPNDAGSWRAYSYLKRRMGDFDGVVEALRGNTILAAEQLKLADENVDVGRLSIITTLAYGYRILGQDADKHRLLNELDELARTRPVSPGYWAVASLARGDSDATMFWLERAAGTRAAGDDELSILLLKWNAFSDEMLDRPEFVEVRGRLLELT